MASYLKSTAYTRAFKLIQSSDHITKLTGATATVNISKAGAAFGAAAGTVTEVANGWYKVALTTADTGTAGDLAFYITASSADDTDFVDQVVDPAAANLGVNVVNWNGTVVATPATAGIPDVNTKNMNNVAATAITTIKAVQGLATDGVVPTVTTVTNQLTAAAIATGIWQDTTAGDFTTALSVGKSVMNGVALGTGLTVANVTNAPTAGDFTATMKTSIGTAVAASAVASVTAAVSVTGDLTATMKTSVTTACTASTPIAASVSGAVGSVTGAVGSVTAGCSLTSGERNSVADALLDRSAGVETSFTPRQSLRLMLSALVGKLSGAATTTVVIRDVNDAKNRISATVDSSGNRSAVTTDVT